MFDTGTIFCQFVTAELQISSPYTYWKGDMVFWYASLIRKGGMTVCISLYNLTKTCSFPKIDNPFILDAYSLILINLYELQLYSLQLSSYAFYVCIGNNSVWCWFALFSLDFAADQCSKNIILKFQGKIAWLLVYTIASLLPPIVFTAKVFVTQAGNIAHQMKSNQGPIIIYNLATTVAPSPKSS